MQEPKKAARSPDHAAWTEKTAEWVGTHPVIALLIWVAISFGPAFFSWYQAFTGNPFQFSLEALTTLGGIARFSAFWFPQIIGVFLVGYVAYAIRVAPAVDLRRLNSLEDEVFRLRAVEGEKDSEISDLKKEFSRELARSQDVIAKLREELSSAEPDPMDQLERVAADDLRVLWRTCGDPASWSIFHLLRTVRSALQDSNPLAPLMQSEVDPLNAGRADMIELFHDGVLEDVSIETVRNRFANFFRAYIRGVRLYHMAGGDLGYLREFQEHEDKYLEWSELHERFEREANRHLQRESLTPLRLTVESLGWQRFYADDRFGLRALLESDG